MRPVAASKFVALTLRRSSSMLAEGIHSVADPGNQVLLLVGGTRAKRQASPERPFGYCAAVVDSAEERVRAAVPIATAIRLEPDPCVGKPASTPSANGSPTGALPRNPSPEQV